MNKAPSSVEYSVRQLLPSDAEAFRALHLEALRAYPAAFAMAYEEECDLPLAEFQSRLDHLIVFGGFVNGALAGIATLQRQPLMKRRHMAMVWGMYVKDEFRGSGLAAAIFQAVIDRAESEVDQLELYVAVGNESASRFYKRFGFERYGVMRRSLRVQGVDYDAEMMVRIFR
ncbi:MAG TPA: GNAT family N-acetyltransferase [Azospirillum sp.]|nr:GNAT family N-acetyltransferase [Azospirillum sp.]